MPSSPGGVHRYYEGGVSSVYLWDLDEQGAFAGVVLLQKGISSIPLLISPTISDRQDAVIDTSAPSPNKKSDRSGQWDAIHVFEALERGRTASYKLTSTIILSMKRQNPETIGNFTLSGSLTRQT